MHRYIVSRILLVFPTLFGAASARVPADAPHPGRHLPGAARLGRQQLHRRRARQPATPRSASTGRCIVQFLDFMWGLVTARFRQLDVVGQARHRRDRDPLPDLARGRGHGDDHRRGDRDPARHDLGLEAEHLDRPGGPHLLDRRARDPGLLARHRIDPDRARRHAGDHRAPLDAADRLRAAVEGPDPQPVDRHAAGA